MNKITFIQTSYSNVGGVEVWSKGLSEHLRVIGGYTTNFLCAYEKTQDNVVGFSESVSSNFFVKIWKLFARALKIRAYVIKHRPTHLIVSVDNMIISTTLALRMAPKRFRPRAVAVLHQQIATTSRVNQIMIVSALKKKVWSAIVGVSHGISDEVSRLIGDVSAGRVQTIYNFTDVQKNKIMQSESVPEDMESGTHTAISMGRLESVKGFDRLISSWVDVVRSIPDARLYILGEGNDRGVLQELIKSLSLEQHVYLLGVRSNIFPYLAKTQMYICSSRFESFGLSIIEAMSLGKKIVSIDCDFGPREIMGVKSIEDGAYPYQTPYGYLVQEDGLAKGIIQGFLADVDGAVLERRAADFDIQHTGKKWLHILQ